MVYGFSPAFPGKGQAEAEMWLVRDYQWTREWLLRKLVQ
jgi:hypothetical protein